MTETTSDATPESLRAALADSLAPDLEAFMAGHEAVAGSTSLPAVSADDAPTAPKAPASLPSSASPPTGEPRRYAGKYTSAEELEKGYNHLFELHRRTMADLAAAKGSPAPETTPEASPLAPTVPSLPSARVNPVERAKARAAEVLGKFSEKYTVEPDEMREVVSAIADEAIESRLAPMDRMAEAEEYMRANHPAALAHGTEIAAFIASTPIVQKIVARSLAEGEYEDAMEYAWERYQLSKGLAAETAGRAAAAEAEAARVVSRVDATAPHASTGSGVHAPAEPELTPDEMKNLVDMYHAGYRTPLLRATIAKTLPDELFDPKFVGYGF